jgi:hypothetical protein
MYPADAQSSIPLSDRSSVLDTGRLRCLPGTPLPSSISPMTERTTRQTLSGRSVSPGGWRLFKAVE